MGPAEIAATPSPAQSPNRPPGAPFPFKLGPLSGRLQSPRKRAAVILERLKQLYPGAICSLHWRNPFELLVATMLSAQCTDERVNLVTPALFKRFPTARALADSTAEEVERYVRSTGFYRNKARNIVASARLLLERHGGAVPHSMEELLQLPGVARKTASVVLAWAFGINAGVTVDTHVRRLSQRLGLSSGNTPGKIEPDLMVLVPRSEWHQLSIQLIFHGRAICTARRAHCEHCGLADLCPSHPLRQLRRRRR